MVLALTASLLSSPMITSAAFAQDEDDDSGFNEEDTKPKKLTRAAKAAQDDAGTIREINRGFYGKASAGVSAYLLNFSRSVDAGTNVTLAVGQDFVDTEKQSMAWEVAIGQGVHNGAAWYEQAGAGCYTTPLGGSEPCTEGDLRTYTLQANYEISFYPVRRIGIGARIGAGVLYSPLLIEPNAYADEVLGDFEGDPGLHNSPKPVVFVGPTFEYYTKLSHFSIGVDVDVVYGIGWDLGVNGTGSLKYTF
ncbi:MAG: adventurous gliding motility protein CglE [Pseudomonadota bacterium]|nr:adventurous gliding motility protein CglE [Pseudomonadota bacterium]